MPRMILLAAVFLLTGCSIPGDRLSAGCEAQGLTPGTDAFEQCTAAAAAPKVLSLQHEVSRQMIFGK